MIKVIEVNTIEEYNKLNNEIHKVCSKLKNYNSPMYASEIPLESVKGTYLLLIIEKFEKHLDLDWKEFDASYIKVNEL